jgi:hypothetical protein
VNGAKEFLHAGACGGESVSIARVAEAFDQLNDVLLRGNPAFRGAVLDAVVDFIGQFDGECSHERRSAEVVPGKAMVIVH